ncbi:cell division protein FtsA [Psychrobacter pygoscelis]|uniref:cell division protein FtsA n=1 Tax=Psychrobacter pygoscelis TaxID=2488563 RepID=UPI00103B924A|nr:cell division protein FtsA [Psychrobacter pygoscelis]
MKKTENLVVIHLSASAVYAVIGQVVSASDIRIMGVGQIANNDFFQGQIKHWERLKSAIRQAIQDAEDMANCRVHSVWLTLSTPELVSKNSAGNVVIEEERVQTKDIVRALSLAKSKDMPNNYYLMHHCQQGIYVDDQENMVDDVIGMYANNISVMYHLMMMPVASRQNIQKLLQECDVSIDHMLFDAVSSAEYSLMREEREQGVCLIDIGASTTSVCVYKENKLIFTGCVPQGSLMVTMDISADMNISMIEAEKLKKRHGTVDVNSIDPSQFVLVKPQGSTDEITVNMHNLAEIIAARYIEIFKAVFGQVVDAGLFDYLDRGVVLSGGGSTIKGIIPFAKKLLNMPVFLTNPHTAITAYHHGEDDEAFKRLSSQVNARVFQTAFGALLYSQSEQFRYSEKSSPDALAQNKVTGLMQRLNQVLKRLL